VFEKNLQYVNARIREKRNIKYCSVECRKKAKENSVQITCCECGKPAKKRFQDFTKNVNNFCSRSCANRYNNRIRPKRKRKQKFCIKCGDFIDKDRDNRRKLCDKCLVDKLFVLKNMSLKEYRDYIGLKKMSSCRFSDRIKYLNRIWNKNILKLPCQCCGYTRHTELSHKKPISKFSENDKLSEVNSAENNIVLCPTHHWEYDNGFLTFEQIPMR
jgi:hypothetical protein